MTQEHLRLEEAEYLFQNGIGVRDQFHEWLCSSTKAIDESWSILLGTAVVTKFPSRSLECFETNRLGIRVSVC
jgi:hypothetical protein